MKTVHCIYIVSLLLLSACSSQHSNGPSPSQNPQLNAISPSSAGKPEKEGYLQSGYDQWEKEDWEPNTRTTPAETESIESTATTDQEDNTSKRFKLQDYVEKWERYSDRNASGPSHKEKLDTMPVIGVPK